MAREQILRTARLTVTSWLPADVDELALVHGDAETMRFVRHGRPETRAETAALIERYRTEHAGTGVTKWRLADPDDRLVGRAGFGQHARGRELGYTLRRDVWGQGLATEIAGALVGWHRDHAADGPLHAYVAADNPASRRVLEKVGFEHVGVEVHNDLPCDLFRLR